MALKGKVIGVPAARPWPEDPLAARGANVALVNPDHLK